MPIQYALRVGALLVIVIAGCDRGSSPAPVAADTINLIADPAPSGWPELRFTVRRSIAWLDSSHLGLIDGDRSQVLILGLEGSVRRVGRKGEGPGEFTAPLDLIRSDGGGFVVLDLRSRGFHQFDGGARFIRSHAALGTLVWPIGMKGDTLLGSDQRWGPGLPLRRIVVAIGGPKAQTLFHLDSLDPALGRLDDSGTPEHADVQLLPGGGFVVVNFRSYRILWLDQDGRIIREGEHRVAKLPPPSAEETEELREQAAAVERRTGDRGMADQMRRAADEEARRPVDPVKQIRSDDRGRLWVLTARRDGGDSWFDLFGPDGRFVRVIGIPGDVLRFSVYGGRLAVLQPAADEDPEIDVVVKIFTLPTKGSSPAGAIRVSN